MTTTGSIKQRSSSTAAPTDRRKNVKIDLALQGGGAHGAFTWGVLDRLLEESWLDIEGISGTSAGAMNAAVLVSGYAQNGAQGGRDALAQFWRQVSDAARMSPFKRGPLDILLGRWSLDHSPLFLAFELAARIFSPYSFSSDGINALQGILAKSINFDLLAQSPIKLFVTATNVRTGLGRIFRNHDLCIDALLASACLPTLFQAVVLNEEAYWDGGYSGNPTITPLVRECSSHDTILVQINPLERPGTPKTANDIFNRINEISFNSPLLKELRMIALLRQAIGSNIDQKKQQQTAESFQWAHMRMHLIVSDRMNELGSSSKLNAEWAFFLMLRDEGRRVAELFLAEHGAKIGKQSSFDLDPFLKEW